MVATAPVVVRGAQRLDQGGVKHTDRHVLPRATDPKRDASARSLSRQRSVAPSRLPTGISRTLSRLQTTDRPQARR